MLFTKNVFLKPYTLVEVVKLVEGVVQLVTIRCQPGNLLMVLEFDYVEVIDVVRLVRRRREGC